MTSRGSRRKNPRKDFNPHHPQGGDELGAQKVPLDKDFNPHHPQGGDNSGNLLISKDLIFQSTPPARWWQTTTVYKVINHLFQSTPPARWWHLLTNISDWYKIFQSTPPARWWQQTPWTSRREMEISIHTTRKVVTHPRILFLLPTWISIHTTRKVVTAWIQTVYIKKGFQSTPPARWWLRTISLFSPVIKFQSTPPARWWQQFCTKTTLNSYSSSPTIHTQFTLHLTFFHIKKQPQAISHQNSGANPPGISCALQVRTKKSEALSH